MNRLERELMSGNCNKAKLRELARIDVAMASLQYDEMVTLHEQIRAEIQPKINRLINANLRLDMIENDYRERESVDKVSDRETSGFVYGETCHANAKYKTVYSIGKLDNESLASQNDTLTGSIIEKSVSTNH